MKSYPFSLSTFSSIFLFSILIQSVMTKDVCSCAPLVYEWRLDFQRECVPRNIAAGPNQGIKDLVCSIESVKQSNTTLSMTPIRVTAYQFIELDLMLTPLKSESTSDTNLKDGDLIEFSSVVASDQSIIPGGFQVSMLGENSAQQQIVLKWLVRYSNICEEIPFSSGNSIGWMVYVSQSQSIVYFT